MTDDLLELERGDAPLRAEARRNLARVLEAAGTLFATKGAAVSIEAIAKLAGVGVGTIYRRFPTKAALVEAVVVNVMKQVADEVESVAESEPDETALFSALHRIAELGSSRHDLKEAHAHADIDLKEVASPIFSKVEMIGSELLVRAQRASVVSADVRFEEVLALSPARLLATVEDGLRLIASD